MSSINIFGERGGVGGLGRGGGGGGRRGLLNPSVMWMSGLVMSLSFFNLNDADQESASQGGVCCLGNVFFPQCNDMKIFRVH